MARQRLAEAVKKKSSRKTAPSRSEASEESRLKILGLVKVLPIKNLKPNTWNPNRLTDHQKLSLRHGLVEDGWVASQPLLVWGSDEKGVKKGIIIDGEHRWVEATKLGFVEGPMVVLEKITEAAAKALTIKLDAKRGKFDDEALAALIKDLSASADRETLGLSLGFDEEQIQGYLDFVIGDLDIGPPASDEVPPIQKAVHSKLGGLYELGQHRLYCGDATETASWAQVLLNGEKAQLVWIDPPYNVAYKGGMKVREAIENDEMSETQFSQFLKKTFEVQISVCELGRSWYVSSPASPSQFEFAFQLKRLGIWRQTLIWDKQQMALGHSDYRYDYEPIFYGWVPRASHYFTKNRDQASMLRFRRPASNPDHPTQKPVPLVAQCIRNSSKPNQIVVDGFAGSGTTLMAAAQENRIARVIEMKPAYCDVIRRRWTAYAKSNSIEPGSGALE